MTCTDLARILGRSVEFHAEAAAAPGAEAGPRQQNWASLALDFSRWAALDSSPRHQPAQRRLPQLQLPPRVQATLCVLDVTNAGRTSHFPGWLTAFRSNESALSPGSRSNSSCEALPRGWGDWEEAGPECKSSPSLGTPREWSWCSVLARSLLSDRPASHHRFGCQDVAFQQVDSGPAGRERETSHHEVIRLSPPGDLGNLLQFFWPGPTCFLVWPIVFWVHGCPLPPTPGPNLVVGPLVDHSCGWGFAQVWWILTWFPTG